MIRVFIVAAAAESRSGLEALLHGDTRFTIVGTGPSMTAWGLSSLEPAPDVVLMEGSGEEKLPSVLRFGETTPIVLLTDGLSRAGLRTALHSGVRAILGRSPSSQEIAAAIEATAAGLTALGPEQADALLPPVRLDAEIAVEPLTEREIEVLALMAEGAANKEIAHRLAISEHTAKFHVSSILGKLGATSRTEAVKEGIRRGLVLV